MKDLYYILGTDPGCTPAELTAAYRKLSQKLQVPGQEYDHFIDRHFEYITDAYQTLSDPNQRKKYDAAFKKHQQQKLYFFKLKYLNIAVTLSLLVFTGLFGYYVMQSLSGSKAKKPLAVVTPTELPPAVKHFKKKHKPAPVSPKGKKKPPVEVDDEADAEPDVAANVPAPVQKPAPVTEKKQGWVRQAPVTEKEPVAAETKPPVVKLYDPKLENKPAPAEASAIAGTATAVLEGNVTGLIYLHQTANYRSAVVASIPNHSKVSVLEKNQSFYKVLFNNQTGYVPKWTVHEQ